MFDDDKDDKPEEFTFTTPDEVTVTPKSKIEAKPEPSLKPKAAKPEARKMDKPEMAKSVSRHEGNPNPHGVDEDGNEIMPDAMPTSGSPALDHPVVPEKPKNPNPHGTDALGNEVGAEPKKEDDENK